MKGQELLNYWTGFLFFSIGQISSFCIHENQYIKILEVQRHLKGSFFVFCYFVYLSPSLLLYTCMWKACLCHSAGQRAEDNSQESVLCFCYVDYRHRTSGLVKCVSAHETSSPKRTFKPGPKMQ